MHINPDINYQKFGRAFSTKEMKQYKNLLADAKKALGTQDTEAIVFDFNVPSEQGYNTAIGTTFSDMAQPFIGFLKKIADINSIQMQPQGKITKTNTSPYSGTNFAIGDHIIDLKKLTCQEYASLLSEDDIKQIDDNYPKYKHIRELQTDYDFVLGQDNEEGIQHQILHKAFVNFKIKIQKNEPTAIALNKEFIDFKNKNSDWLEKNAFYEALSVKYQTREFKKWEEPDRSLYSSNTPFEIKEERKKTIKNEYQDLIEFENFKQFIADKQQKEAKKSFNIQGIKLYGDCLIGFSYGEMWSNIDCFQDNLYYGGPDPNCPETNYIQTWGLPALDYTQLGECNGSADISKLGKAGKLLYDKYQKFFERYDGIRVDAAWQFATPFIYHSTEGRVEEVKQPEINYTIFNIMKSAAQNSDNNVNDDGIMLELVGLSAGKSREMTLNRYPHLYTTAYAEYDECPAKFIERGYKQGMFYAGVSNHDNDSMINIAKDEFKRNNHSEGIRNNYQFNWDNLAFNVPEYNNQTQQEKKEEDFRNAKFAEIFTSAKQFFTLPDFFGMRQRINISGKTDKSNWSVRIPNEYEDFYYRNLANGYGINIPKALENALIMRHIKAPELISKCKEAADILRSKGPMTEQEANLAENKGLLHHKFEYKV